MKVGTLLGIAVYTAILLIGGTCIGVQLSARTDPLRHDSAQMEAWLDANNRGDSETMWNLTDPDTQKKYGHDEFINEFTITPGPNPPKRTFIASVPMPIGGWEMFYSLDFGKGGPVVVAVYVDSDGKFEMFAP